MKKKENIDIRIKLNKAEKIKPNYFSLCPSTHLHVTTNTILVSDS